MSSTADLKQAIMDFIDDVKDNVSRDDDERGDMMLVAFFFNKLHPDMVLHHVVNALLPHKDKVEKRQEGFFLENKFLFSGLPNDRVNHYMNLIKNGYIDEDSRRAIYEHLDHIIMIAEKNKKKKKMDERSVKAFESITVFVEALWDVFGEPGVNPLALYRRLMEKVQSSDTKEVAICLSGFKHFLVTYHDDLVANNLTNIPRDALISYGTSKSVHIPVGVYLRNPDADIVSVVRQHLLTISGVLAESGSDRMNEIAETLKKCQIDTSTKEGAFVNNIMMKAAAIDTSANADPMTAITGLLSSGLLNDMMSGMKSGVEKGDMDIGALIGSMKGLMDGLMPQAQSQAPRPSQQQRAHTAPRIEDVTSSSTSLSTATTPKVEETE